MATPPDEAAGPDAPHRPAAAEHPEENPPDEPDEPGPEGTGYTILLW